MLSVWRSEKARESTASAAEAMQTAVRHALRVVDLGDGLALYISADQSGTPLEVGVVGVETEHPRIVHAMNLRPKFYDYL